MTEAARSECPIVELRRYRLWPGARETLISLFDRELVEPQEAVGMQVLGQFRDLDDDDCFIWLRGFRDMRTRRLGLESFYGGPVWQAHRDAANATMISSDDVLLLRPARPGSGLKPAPDSRRPRGAGEAVTTLVVITCYFLRPGSSEAFAEGFEREATPLLRAAGATVRALYRTEHSLNTYPALPVREDVEVFVSVAEFRDEVAYIRHLDELERRHGRHDVLAPAVRERLQGAPVISRLQPTARSLLGA